MVESLIGFDGGILTFIQTSVRCAPLDIFMKIVTTLGDAGLIWILACVAMLIYRKTRVAGIAATTSLIIEAVSVNVVLKNLFMRDRPYNVVEGLVILIKAPHDYSFPSGHAGSSFAVAVVILLMLPRKWGITAITSASLMGISRLYVGVHYPTDILAGALIGTATALVSVFIIKRLRDDSPVCENKPQTTDDA